MLIRAGIVAACLLIAGQAHAQKEPRREVDLVTEPRPGQEFVHVHASGPSKPNKHYIKGVQGDANPEEVSYVSTVSKTKLKSPSIVSPKKAQAQGQGAGTPVGSSPITPAKDSRLLRLTSYSGKPQEAAPSQALDENHDFGAHNITRGQLLHKPEDVSIEDEGMTGFIDESAVATPEERAILEQKHKSASSYAVEEFPVELPSNHKLSPDAQAAKAAQAQAQAQAEEADRQAQLEADSAGAEQKNSNVERHLEKKVLNLETTKYEVIKLNEEETEKDGGLGKPSKKDDDEGQIDFVDSPLGDKVLTPSGSSKASRTSIKKGPNGQDYEYEYVYYYYDEDEDDNNTRDKSVSGSPAPAPAATAATVTPAPTRRPQLQPSSAVPEYRETPPRFRGKTTTDAPTAPANTNGVVYENNFRYSNTDSTVERGTLPVAEPASNEVLPPSPGPRYQGRGRQLVTQAPTTNIPVQEETLETSTRFPSRSRTPPVATEDTYVPIQTTLQQPAPVKETRGRNSGNVKRPSVELVDSSSFQTHSNGVSAPDQEYFAPQYSTDFSNQPQPTAVEDDTLTTHAVTHQRGSRIRPSQAEEDSSLGVQSVSSERLPPAVSGSTHKQDLEEYVSTPTPAVETTRTRGFSQFRPLAPEGTVEIGTGTEAVSPSSVATTPATGTWRNLVNPAPSVTVTGSMPDKAALDLWAYLQKTQNDESNNIIDDDRGRSEDNTEDVGPVVHVSPALAASTPYLTPSSTPYLTPSSTPSASPSPVTTTTEAPTSPSSTSTAAPTGRGRYRGSLTANRNRFKVSSTEQTPPTEENTTARRKFTPSHQRAPGHVSAYGRRGSKKTTSEDSNTSSTEASQSADEAESPKPFGSSTRGRYRGSGSRNSGVSTTTSAPVSTEARTRPAFNAERYNRRRGGSSLRATSTAAPTEGESENKDDSAKKEENEQEANASSTTSRPSIRGRVNVASPSVRPLRPGPRISLARNRLPTATKAQPTAEESETSPSPSSTTAVAEEAQQSNSESHSDTVSEAPVASTTQDALTRLRNRPRLHVQSNRQTKPASPPALASNRRQLVSGLLPKRRPSQADAASTTAEQDASSASPATQSQEPHDEEAAAAEGDKAASPESEAPSSPVSPSEQPSTSPPETKLATLIGRRRNLALTGRRPGTLNRQTNGESAN